VFKTSDVESHVVTESISTTLAISVAALSTLRFVSRRRRLYLLVALGYCGTAVLDLQHALSTSRWLAAAMPSQLEALIPWSWLPGRVFLGAFMVLAGLRLLHEKRGVRSRVSDRALVGVSGLGIFVVAFVIAHVELGPAHLPGPVGRPAEFIAGGLMLLGVVLALRARPWTPMSFVPWLVTSMGLGAVGQLFLMPFSTEVFDLPFRLAHVFKLMSYVAMGVGLLYSVLAAFRSEKRLSKGLQHERTRLAEILWSTDAGTWEWDLRDGSVLVNDRLAATLGHKRVELEGDLTALWRSRCHADDIDEADAAVQAHLSGDADHYETEFRLRHKDGGWVWILDRGKIVERAEDGRGVRMSGTYQDITARKAAEALAARQRDMLARDVATLQSQGRALARQADELAQAAEQQRALACQLQREVDRRALAEQRERHRAHHDSLTELPNRRFLERLGDDAIEDARAHGTALAVLFFDIDGFKSINDSLGHAAGDLLLVAIAGRLRTRVRSSDVVSRVGGDEFVVLLSRDCSPERAGQLAASIVHTIAQPFNLRGSPAHVGASVGIALFPGHGATFEHLLRTADAAMYEVKQAGKSGWRVAQRAAPSPARES
jgi:diguanylate cyclase (GGDEF)-like protein/PAS domain S-box-containing protein